MYFSASARMSSVLAASSAASSAFGASASLALRNFFMFIGAIAMMVVTSPKLSALVLVAIPIIVLPLVASGRSVRTRSRHAQDTLAEATSFAAENLGAVRTMQAFGAERSTVSRFAAAVEPRNDAVHERRKRDQAARDRSEPTVPSTIADEQATNPFLRAHVPAVAAAAGNHVGRALDDPVEVFAALRAWKNVFS